MSDEEEYEDATSIGVGMGGSCPSCRAPVDLGQEFCLECGSPIRFTPRQRRKQRQGDRVPVPPPTNAATSRGFPWIPFAIVLLLVAGGVAFAFVEGGDSDKKSNSKSKTDEALPEITNSVPETTSTTQTTTLQDCDPAQPLGDTQPATDPSASGDQGGGFGTNDPAGDFGDADSSGGEQIPTIAPDGSSADSMGDFDGEVPSTTPGDDSSAAVTVDQNGNLCSPSDASTTPDPSTTDTTPTFPSDTTPTNGTTTPTSTTPTTPASGDWPAGRTGWTVVVDNKTDRASANRRAGEVQGDNFDAGVLISGDFVSLCPGYFVVFSGNFNSKADATRHAGKLNDKGYFGLYVREIRTTGASADCSSSRPQN